MRGTTASGLDLYLRWGGSTIQYVLARANAKESSAPEKWNALFSTRWRELLLHRRGRGQYNRKMAFAIVYSPEAVDHLRALPKRSQVLVLDQVEEQLTHEPILPTRKRKLLRPNPLAPWELRLGDIRVFYEVREEAEPKVIVKAVGVKRHNELWIGEERITL
jgi:mRNA-degrading endonuclease RelE of RelBE toxin-antitoxin system